MAEIPEPFSKAQQDQIMAGWRDTIPPMLKSMFDGFVKAGFTAEQALDLTKFAWRDINNQPRSNSEF
jgi:hypothetical protein